MYNDLSKIPMELPISTGQLGIAIKQVLALKTANVYRRKRDSTNQKLWQDRAETLYSFAPSLHTKPAEINNFVLSNLTDPWVTNALVENRSLTYRALKEAANLTGSNGLQNLNNDPLPFAATQAQLRECLNEAKRRYPEAGRARTTFYQSCVARIPYKNIITEHVGQSGGVLLYTTIKTSQSNFNQVVSQKDSLQGQWVAQAAASTRIPQIQVLDVLKISVIDQFGETPENLEAGFRNFIAPINSIDAEVITQGTKTPDILLTTGGSALPTTKAGAIVNLILNIARVVVNLFKKFKERNAEAKRREQAFADTPQIEENFVMRCFDFNGVQQDCTTSGEGQIQKCFDNNGNEITCLDEQATNNGIGLVAGAAAVLGLGFFFFKGSKK